MQFANVAHFAFSYPSKNLYTRYLYDRRVRDETVFLYTRAGYVGCYRKELLPTTRWEITRFRAQTDDSPAYRSYSSLFSPFYQRKRRRKGGEGEEEGKEEGARLEKERNHISNQPLVPEKWSWLEKGPQTSRTINACVCVIPQQNGRQF